MESNIKNKKQVPPKSVSESLDMKSIPAARAPRIYLTEEEIISLMRKEAAAKRR